MRFIYDPRKSELNNEKHGIDFEEAKALWDDPSVIEAPSNKCGEQEMGRNRKNERLVLAGNLCKTRLRHKDHLGSARNAKGDFPLRQSLCRT